MRPVTEVPGHRRNRPARPAEKTRRRTIGAHPAQADTVATAAPVNSCDRPETASCPDWDPSADGSSNWIGQ